MIAESFAAKRGGILATGPIARQDLPSGSCHAWQDLRAMHDLRGLCSEKGPSLARCSPGVFPNGDLLGILNTWRAYLAKISSFWMHGGDILPGRGVFTVRGSLGNASGRYFARMRPFVCPECASRVLHSKGAPSSVRNKSRKRFVSALQGFGGRCRPPPAPRVAGVGGGDADRTEAEPFACSEMLLEDASSKTLWLRRRTKDDNCRIPSRQSAASVPWDSGGCGTAEFRVLDIAVDADRTEAEPFAAKRSETG